MFKKGDIVGNYEVLSNETKKINYKIHYFCINGFGRKKWIPIYRLKNAHTKGIVGNQGWSTRTKNKHLPKHVSYYPSKTKPYRVCKKCRGTTLTVGYYATLDEAKRMAQNEELN